jgi:hypothetical protein
MLAYVTPPSLPVCMPSACVLMLLLFNRCQLGAPLCNCILIL